MLYYAAAGLVLMGLVLSLLDVLGVALGAGGFASVAFLAATMCMVGQAVLVMIEHHHHQRLSTRHS
jgi:hypothetical protein